MDVNDLKLGEVAGISLCGIKKDGKYFLGASQEKDLNKWKGTIVDELPEEIDCNGSTYTLEEVKEFGNEGFFNADYC